MTRAGSAPRAGGRPAGRLWRADAIGGCVIAARDGDIGSVRDLFFDESSWTVRHIVVDTGGWLSGRRVLISPRAITRVDLEGERLECSLERAQVERSPDVDTDMPVSRQKEVELALHYQYPFYWTGPLRWGATTDPVTLAGAPAVPSGSAPAVPVSMAEEVAARVREGGDPHLHSAAAVRGYGIRATDGELGHVADFLIEEASWAIRYLVVDPRNWWPGAHVVISVDWVAEVRWDDSVVEVDVTRQAVRAAPTYDPAMQVDRAWEAALHGHHRRPGYWERDPEAWRRRRAS